MPEYERCTRCSGEGSLTIRLGKPDPNRNTHAPYEGPWCIYPTSDCPVCLGTGWRKVRVERAVSYDGAFHVHSTKAKQMSFDEIFDKMNL